MPPLMQPSKVVPLKEFIQARSSRDVSWRDPQPLLSPSAKLKLMSCFEKMHFGWKTGSLYEKMGIIPIVSNIKGIIEIVPSILRTCTWFVCGVAFGALFLVSCCFSQCNKDLSSIRNNLTLSNISKNTFSETLLGLTVVSGQYSLQNLTSASMYHGLIQQIPVFGNLKYAEALALQALQKAEIAQPPPMVPEEGSKYDPFPDYKKQGCHYVDPKKPAKGSAVPSRRGSIIGFDTSFTPTPKAAGAASGIATARTPDFHRGSLSSLTLTPETTDHGATRARSRASTFDDSASTLSDDDTGAKPLHIRQDSLDSLGLSDDDDTIALSGIKTPIIPATGQDSLSSLGSLALTDDDDASTLSSGSRCSAFDTTACSPGFIATATSTASAGAASGGACRSIHNPFATRGIFHRPMESAEVALMRLFLENHFRKIPEASEALADTLLQWVLKKGDFTISPSTKPMLYHKIRELLAKGYFEVDSAKKTIEPPVEDEFYI